MSKTVTLRKSGNSRVLTLPADFDVNIGTEFEVSKAEDGSVIYRPLEHQNIFDSQEWQEYDYQSDLNNDPELSELNPVGKENIE
ncbi:type II toxin-antitoxin system PemI/MazE family antitoxin [Levilactobacillus sp. N40-8-2]|uniref:type II toxin-antitoxin system PemI/MazE family antitoxin n=1 Tax=Levilactobacillus muriae TaxID=3238987 RepID=UPI0038B349DC